MKRLVCRIRWYARGVPLACRLIAATLAGTDAQFEQVAADIETYHQTRGWGRSS